MKFYYVYVLQNTKNFNNLYTGFSENLRERVKEHNRGQNTSTKNKRWKLIYYESYLNKTDALGREKFLKGGSGRKYLNKQLRYYFAEQA